MRTDLRRVVHMCAFLYIYICNGHFSKMVKGTQVLLASFSKTTGTNKIEQTYACINKYVYVPMKSTMVLPLENRPVG